MTYQEYINNPFATEMSEQEYMVFGMFAEVAISKLIQSLVPVWKDVSVCQEAINNALAIQVGYIKKHGLDTLSTGKEVKSENLDGYSRSYGDTTVVGGVNISLFAQQVLEVAFRETGLMYRGL